MPSPVLPSRGKPHLVGVLFTADQIRLRIDGLASELIRDFGQGDLTAVAVLKGSFVFLADLARALSIRGIHLTIDFMTLSSYGADTATSGHVLIQQAPSLPVTRGPVLLIDDILDTGLTLQAARNLLIEKGATHLRTCVLLDKPARRKVSPGADYAAFQIEDVFAVGYGLDYDNRYRHLPYLAALSFEDAIPSEGSS
jgi:hypoxanthine phosphoribosyltransferase